MMVCINFFISYNMCIFEIMDHIYFIANEREEHVVPDNLTVKLLEDIKRY
jgi:hypothetical protein